MTTKEDKAKGEPEKGRKPEKIAVGMSPEEGLLWIVSLWFLRNQALHGPAGQEKSRGFRIAAIEALVLRELGIEARGPTRGPDSEGKGEVYVKAGLDEDSLLLRVFGAKDRRAWATGAEGAPRFEASVNLTDEEWWQILTATAETCREGLGSDGWITQLSTEVEDDLLETELLGGTIYALREASPRNRDLFEAWHGPDDFRGVPYRLWRRLALNRLLTRLPRSG